MRKKCNVESFSFYLSRFFFLIFFHKDVISLIEIQINLALSNKRYYIFYFVYFVIGKEHTYSQPKKTEKRKATEIESKTSFQKEVGQDQTGLLFL